MHCSSSFSIEDLCILDFTIRVGVLDLGTNPPRILRVVKFWGESKLSMNFQLCMV